eukprot:COSAG01_NODE_14470_length_1450_cov_1.275352_2_plen_145_part_00
MVHALAVGTRAPPLRPPPPPLLARDADASQTTVGDVRERLASELGLDLGDVGNCWGGVAVGEDDALPLSAFPALWPAAAAAAGVAGGQAAAPAPCEVIRRWVIRRVRPLAVFERPGGAALAAAQAHVQAAAAAAAAPAPALSGD